MPQGDKSSYTDKQKRQAAHIRRTSALPVRHAADGEKILRGRIYIAQSDYHLMVNGSHIRIVRGPKENFQRPSIDALFRTAAEFFGARVAGVILTGNLDDGTAGLYSPYARKA